jgi:bacterioferritin-associated ferredoxin
MIVCVCHRVSDRDIRRLAENGCHSFDELQMVTGVATCCGQCENCARDTFAQVATQEQAVCFVRKEAAPTN